MGAVQVLGNGNDTLDRYAQTLDPARRNQEIDPEAHAQEIPGTQVRVGSGRLGRIQPGVGAIDVLDDVTNESGR